MNKEKKIINSSMKYVTNLFPKTGIWHSRDEKKSRVFIGGRWIDEFNELNLPYNTANNFWMQNYIASKICGDEEDLEEQGVTVESIISVILDEEKFGEIVKSYQAKIVDFELISNFDKHQLDTDTEVCCNEIKSETYERLTKILKMPELIASELIENRADDLFKKCDDEKSGEGVSSL